MRSPRAHLLADVSDSHHGTLSALLSPAEPQDRPLPAWLRAHLLPGLAAGRMDGRPACARPSLRAWARRRAAALLPGEPVHRLELRWYRDTFAPGGEAPVARQAAGVTAIPLAGDAPCAR